MTPQTTTQKTAEPEAVSAELVPAADAPSGGGALAKMADDTILAALPVDNEWGDVDDGDYDPESKGRIPHIAQDRRNGGGFVDPETGETMLGFDFIWLAKGRSRVYFDKQFDAKKRTLPACSSSDGIVPDSKIAEPMSPRCAGCPFHQWDETTKKFPCSSSVEALVYLPGPSRVARVRFSGLGHKPAMLYWESFQVRVPRRPPLSVVSHVELVETRTDNGTFLVPSFSVVSALPRELATGLIRERDAMLGDWKADVADDVASGRTVEDCSDVGSAATVDMDGEPF